MHCKLKVSLGKNYPKEHYRLELSITGEEETREILDSALNDTEHFRKLLANELNEVIRFVPITGIHSTEVEPEERTRLSSKRKTYRIAFFLGRYVKGCIKSKNIGNIGFRRELV